jgi:hypothetical protein
MTEEEMSETRAEAVRLFGLGGGRPALPTFSRALDAYAEEVRAETLAEADAYLTRHGYADSAYLLRTATFPRT